MAFPVPPSGLVLRVRAHDALYQDAAKTTLATAQDDPVGNLPDQAGGGYDFTQAGAARPTLDIDGVTGWRRIKFDGTSQYLQAAFAGQAQPFTWGFAYRAADAVTTQPLVLDNANNGTRQRGSTDWQTAFGSNHRRGVPSAGVHGLIVLVDGASTITVVNGEQQGTASNAGSAALGTTLYMGTVSNLVQWLNGGIFEFWIRPGLITVAEAEDWTGTAQAHYANPPAVDVPLVGIAPATAGVSALTLVERRVASNAASASAASAALAATRKLAAQAPASSAAEAALSIALALEIEASAEGGALGALNRALSLVGDADALASAEADALLARALSAEAVAASSGSAALSLLRALTGVAPGLSTAAGAAVLARLLTATASAEAQASADLSSSVGALDAVARAESGAAAVLAVGRALGGHAQAAAAASASILAALALAAAAASEGSADGQAAVDRMLSAQTVSEAEVAAGVHLTRLLAGRGDAEAGAQAELTRTALVLLEAVASGTATASGLPGVLRSMRAGAAGSDLSAVGAVALVRRLSASAQTMAGASAELTVDLGFGPVPSRSLRVVPARRFIQAAALS